MPPINAKFQADFSSFYDAVQKAEVHLRSFESGAGRVEKSLDRMVDAFSGRKLVQDATLMAEAVERVGGLSKLTEKELARVAITAGEAVTKMKALGLEVPPALQQIADDTKRMAGAFSLADKAAGLFQSTFGQILAGFSAANLINKAVGALSDWTRGAIQSASAIVDLHEATGASIESVQRWAFVAKDSQVATEVFADAAFKLGVNLSKGQGSVRQAVDELGLSYEALRRQKPEDQFDTIAGALSDLENVQERNRLAVALFGREASTLLPAIGDNYRALANAAKVAEDAQVRAIDESIKAWERFKATAQTNIVSTLGDMVLGAQELSKVTPLMRAEFVALGLLLPGTGVATTVLANRLAELAKAHDILLPSQARVITSTDLVANRLRALDMDALAPLTATQRDQIRQLNDWGVAQSEIAELVGTTATAVKLALDAQSRATQAAKQAMTEAEAELKKYNAASANLIDLLAGAQGVNARVAEAATLFLRLGASQADVATAFNLTRGAVKALSDEMERTNVVTKTLLTSITQLMLENLQARKQLAASQGFDIAGGRLPTDPRDVAFADFDRKMASLRERQAAAGAQGAQVDVSAIETQYYQQLQEALEKAAGAAHAVATAHDRVTGASHGAASGLDRTAMAADLATQVVQQLAGALPSFVVTDSGGGAHDLFGRPVVPGGTLMNLPRTYGRAPGYAEGGPTREGMGYLHAGEFVVPKGGALVRGGGGVTIQSVVINYPIMNDARSKAELARLFGEVVMSGLRSSTRLPSGA